MRRRPLICVRDMEASRRWSRWLLGRQRDHGGDYHVRLVVGGRRMRERHRRHREHRHGSIDEPRLPPGSGLWLWFEAEDFEAAPAKDRGWTLETLAARMKGR